MLSETISWLGGGMLAVLLYVFVSNTLWLLFGSRLVQCLPGVNITGFRGTIKIAAMIFLSLIGAVYWVIKYGLGLVMGNDLKPLLADEIRDKIKAGARIVHKIQR